MAAPARVPRPVKTFALNVLELANNSKNGKLDELWMAYNRRYNRLTFETFIGRLTEAFDAGLIEFAYPATPGIDSLEKVVKFVSTNERGRKFTTYWSSVSLKGAEKAIANLREDLGLNLLKDVNQELFDSLVRHQIYLLRLSGSVRNDVQKLLNDTEADLVKAINKYRAAGAGYESKAGLQRLQALEKYIKTIRLDSWDQINKGWVADILNIARKEVEFQNGLHQAASPVIIDFALPDARTIKAIVTTNPFEGKVMKDWADSIASADIDRILSQIRIGMVQGETGPEIARRIVGSASLEGVDGVTEITRRNAAALTRTAVTAITGMVRSAFIDENAEYFEGERFVATLDSRTTATCRANDGKVFPVGQGPTPPLHWNCRSLRVPIFDGTVLGERPAKPMTMRQLLREFTDEEEIPEVATRDGLPRGYKGTFDEYAKKRIRAVTTRVLNEVSYNEWLKAQPAWFQDDVLGKTRAQLFRTGKLDLDKYVDKAGNELTLKQLASKYRQIFVDAGLDPSEWM